MKRKLCMRRKPASKHRCGPACRQRMIPYSTAEHSTHSSVFKQWWQRHKDAKSEWREYKKLRLQSIRLVIVECMWCKRWYDYSIRSRSCCERNEFRAWIAHAVRGTHQHTVNVIHSRWRLCCMFDVCAQLAYGCQVFRCRPPAQSPRRRRRRHNIL